MDERRQLWLQYYTPQNDWTYIHDILMSLFLGRNLSKVQSDYSD